MNVSLIGATGATGKDLLSLLLKDETIKHVDIFVRCEVDITDPKLTIHVIDFDKEEEWKSLVKGDVLFSCLGTTIKDAGSKAKQWKVDYDYQYQFAKAARENKVNSYVLVSSGLASKKSIFYYTRMKGQLEDAVKELKFPQFIVFNPSILIRKGSRRSAEVMSIKIIKFLNAFGILKFIKPLDTLILAKAMINAVKTLGIGNYSLKGQQITNSIA